MSSKLPESTAGRHDRSQTLAWLYAVFFLSGFCGLVYEIVWVRMLGTVLGNTVYAVNLVLLMFFGGLALGSRLAVALHARVRNQLKTYVWLELGISLGAVLSPFLIMMLNQFSLSAGWSAELSLQRIVLRLVGSGLVLLIPTTLMGATLPVLSAFTVGRDGQAAQKVGRLYFVNTIGSALGAILCAFVGLRLLGIRTTIYVTAAINTGLALYVYLRTRTLVSRTPAPLPAVTARMPQRWLFLYMALGFAAISLQILWTHVLSSVFRNTIYSFASILSVFLTGLALGSRWGSRHGREPLKQIGFMQLTIALYTLLVINLFPSICRAVLQPGTPIEGFGVVLARELGMAALVLLVPTLMMGATFPMIVQVLHQRAGNAMIATGQAYFYNTMGGILAPFLSGFVLLGWLGAKSCMFIALIIFLVIGITLLAERPRYAQAAGALALLLVFFSPKSLTEYLDAEERRIVARHESLSGTVTVVEKKNGSLALKVNNSYAMGAESGAFSERRQGHFPLLLHPRPRKALLIGLGTGDTLGSMSQYGLDQLDCIEILPGVIRLAAYFTTTNDQVIKKPGVRIMLGDGKNYVQTVRDRYDIIVGDLYHPDYAGVSALYSLEHFQAARRRLAPGGFYFQWLPLYQVDRQDVADIAYTFRQVFPYVDLWLADYNVRMPIIGLRGFRDVPDLAMSRFNGMEEARQNPARRAQLEGVALYSPIDVSNAFLGDDATARALGKTGRLNSDDHPRIEFNAPLHRVSSSPLQAAEMMEWLLQIRDRATAQALPIRETGGPEQAAAGLRAHRGITKLLTALTRFSEGQMQPAQDRFIEALTLAPQDRNVYGLTVYHAMLALQEGRYAFAQDLLERISRLHPNDPAVEQARASALSGLGRFNEAAEIFQSILARDPTYEPAYRGLIDALLRSGRRHEAHAVFEEAHRHFPDDPNWQYSNRQP